MTNIKKLMERADKAYYAAEYDKAIELYRQALASSPKNRHVQQYLQKSEELKKLIEAADNAYYVAEYEKAILLYKQILDLDVENKRAQEQIRKAERSRLSRTTNPAELQLPETALYFYKRSRSLIAVGDLDGATKFLRQAIDVATDADGDFLVARELLGNIQNALTAEEFKKKAFEALGANLWLKAESNLNSAVELDPTDDVAHTLLLHLRNLLQAQRLISNLEAGIENARKRSQMSEEIRKIINLTNETTSLSILWQEVVRLFGDYNNKNLVFRNRSMIFRWVMLVIFSVSVMFLTTLWLLYLYPRHRNVNVDCNSIAPGLRAELDYPFYVANGDEDKLEITFINEGKAIDNTLVVVKLTGTANFKYLNPLTANRIMLDKFNHDQHQPEVIPFYIDGSTDSTPGPWQINFSVGECVPKDFHIAMTPIPGLHKFIVSLWGLITASLIGLFNARIKEFFEWVRSFF